MKLDPSTFLRSVAGKAVLATGVVLLAFGGAAAAGFTDVPSLSPSSNEPTLQDESSDDSSSEATDESSDDQSEVDEVESSDDASSADDSASDEPTHGDIVSEFAHTTELEGCEKGQAISDLASSNATDHRQNAESDHNPCDHEGDDESGDDSAEAAEVEAPEVEAPETSGDDESDDADDADEGSHGKSGESHGQSGGSHGHSSTHGHGGGGDD